MPVCRYVKVLRFMHCIASLQQHYNPISAEHFLQQLLYSYSTTILYLHKLLCTSNMLRKLIICCSRQNKDYKQTNKLSLK